MLHNFLFLIKKLDILILKSFIGPFIVTFFVTLFVLVMQFFWLYMDELIGKGIGTWMIIQLLFYMSTTMVPLALPLGILLASIMTFGNMGENFELVAIKSAGISLLRFMRPLLLFIMLVGGMAFLFNNNVIPFANLKALSLLYDLRNSKPALNIRAGQFNKDIDNYMIRVGEKDKDGRTIRNILIYDHSSGRGNDKVVMAKEGEMFPSPNKQFLIFRLKDGWRYEEGDDAKGADAHEQTRMHFKSWDKVFDLSSFKLNRTNQDLFKDAYQMMDISQLNERIDSMGRYQRRLNSNMNIYIGPYITYVANGTHRKALEKELDSSKIVSKHTYKKSFSELVPDSVRAKVVQLAQTQMRNAEGLLNVNAMDAKLQEENFVKFNIEWHRKFTLSFACVLLFLIGAPLGAIIRKGGLGMPLVIAVGFFVVFHIFSITGEKLSKTGSMKPWMGMWMATAMLLPIAFILINQARNDSQIFSKEWYMRVWGKMRRMFVKTKTA
ncbi:MAG: YjgP/YjgQ family permease [Sphingobacteriales bacterium]|nr:MAG: YjgP/YjgQ family permease [Sphingobacteriales bacterium]